MEEKKEYNQLLNAAYRYLGYRMRTQKEVENYLSQKAQQRNISNEYIPQVIIRLTEDGLINDSQFIEEFINSRSKTKPKSTYALTVELLRKGISRDSIESYFEVNTLNEGQLAKQALQKKWLLLKTLPTEKKLKKATDFLRSRGFSFDVIKKTIEELRTSE